MKILVIEDDDVSRLVTARVLKQRFSCTVIEASNGLDGLLAIGKERPNLVLLDVMMPVMDGREVLEAIRSDPTCKDLPVIITSDVRDKPTVMGLLGLGISDFLSKPLNPDDAHMRIARVISTIETAAVKQPVKQQVPKPGRKRLLVVDKDAKFREFVKSVLGTRFEVLEAATGADGLRIALDRNPEIVCLSEGLSLINEQLLAKRLRSSPWEQKSCVYLVSEKGDLAPSDAWLYHGVFRKSYSADTFLKSFAGAMGTDQSMLDLPEQGILRGLTASKNFGGKSL